MVIPAIGPIKAAKPGDIEKICLRYVTSKIIAPKPKAVPKNADNKQATADLLVRTCLKPLMKGSLVFDCGSAKLWGKTRNTKIRLTTATGNINHMKTERQPPMAVMKPI